MTPQVSEHRCAVLSSLENYLKGEVFSSLIPYHRVSWQKKTEVYFVDRSVQVLQYAASYSSQESCGEKTNVS